MIPDYKADVEAAAAKYPEDWRHAHKDGDPRRWDWIRLFAFDLHKKDPRVGLNGKRGNPNDLSMDAINYLDDDGPGRTPEGLRCWVVDVIGGAGGPNPKPQWNDGIQKDPVASSGAWVKPGTKPAPVPVPVPAQKPYPGDGYFLELGAMLEADYTRAGQRLNAGSAVWFARTIWRSVNEGMSIEASTAQSRKEWRAALGLP
jgi:hypothetical protein